MNTMAPIVLGCKVGQISFLGITNLLSNPYKAKQILSRETKSLDIVLLDSIGLPVLAHVPLPPPYARADPGGRGTGGGPDPPPPPLEFWQKSGYQIRDLDRFDIVQHLCKLQS